MASTPAIRLLNAAPRALDRCDNALAQVVASGAARQVRQHQGRECAEDPAGRT